MFSAKVLKIEMAEGSNWLSTKYRLLKLFRQFDSCALYKYRKVHHSVLVLRRPLDCLFSKLVVRIKCDKLRPVSSKILEAVQLHMRWISS